MQIILIVKDKFVNHILKLRNKVLLQGGKYNPSTLYIQAGETVLWKNNCCSGCTVTSNNGLFESGVIKKGFSFPFTFTKSGIYLYHCEKIKDMKKQLLLNNQMH